MNFNQTVSFDEQKKRERSGGAAGAVRSGCGWDSRRQADGGRVETRLPDGDSQIFRFYVFGPSGLKDYGSAMLCCKI